MSTPHTDRASLEQAAHWYALLQADDASAELQQQWQQWLNARAEHQLAWQHVLAVSRRFAPLRKPELADAAVAGFQAARQAHLKRRHTLRAVAGLGLAGCLAWGEWRQGSISNSVLAWAAEQHTAIGQRRQLTLADGSQIWLNSGTALDLEVDDSRRLLRLRSGEILVETASDPARRAFFVETRQASMQALGTRFSVWLDGDQTALNVYAGAVRIRTRSGAQRDLAAGSGARFTAQAIAAPHAADSARMAWSQGLLVAHDITLEEWAAQLSRYRHGVLTVADEVRSLRVMGVYPSDDPEQALALLEQALPVRAQRRLPWWTQLQAR